MEALHPFYSPQFSVALSPSGPAVPRFPTQRHRSNACLQPMRCVLDKKERRSLQFRETNDRGKLREDEVVENGEKEGPLHLNETVDLDAVSVDEAPKKRDEWIL